MDILASTLDVFLLIDSQDDTEVRFPNLTTVPNGTPDPDYGANILLRNCGIMSFEAPVLRDCPGVDLDNCDLVELSLPQMQTDSVRLLNMPNLETVSVPSLIGRFFALNNCPKVRSLALPVIGTCQLDINGDTALQMVSVPALASGEMTVSACPALQNLTATALTVITDNVLGFNVYNNATLSFVSLPALAQCQTTFNINANAALTLISAPGASLIRNSNVVNNPMLTSIDFGDALFTQGYDQLFSGNALDADTVNGILARCVDSNLNSNTIDLSGGTNAAPSGQGLTNKATLVAAGCTVNTN